MKYTVSVWDCEENGWSEYAAAVSLPTVRRLLKQLRRSWDWRTCVLVKRDDLPDDYDRIAAREDRQCEIEERLLAEEKRREAVREFPLFTTTE